MSDHHFIIDYMAEWKHAEELGEEIVCFYVILLFHLSFKPVHLIQLLRLVVPSIHEEVLRIANFPSEHCHYYFNREGTSVYEVSVEYVRIFFRRTSVYFENVHQIIVLTVDIATDRDFFKFIN